jgi:hypothetical protein
VQLKLPRELNHQSDTRSRKGMTERDCATPGVHPRIVISDTEVIQEAQDLNGKSLVELEQPDVLNL